jgi:hypothetical protein
VPTKRTARELPPDSAVNVRSSSRVRVCASCDVDAPHFTIVLPDLAEMTIIRLDRCLDDPIPNPGREYSEENDSGVIMNYDIAVDFMDMTDDRRLWTRVADARHGFVPIAGQFVLTGCDDADPAVAQILSVDAKGRIELQILRGPAESHRHLLASA